MISLGRTSDKSSLGRGLEDRKLLLDEGISDEDENILLYVERFELVFIGDEWGELYNAKIKRPKENMSADADTLLSSAKSGDV